MPQAALRDVTESIRRYGRASVETLALGADDETSDGRVIAQGAELATRALVASSPEARPRPARRRGQAGATR
jgi:hypothetical protein